MARAAGRELHRPGSIFVAICARTSRRRRLSTDAEFLRRVTLTTTGQLPTPEDVRSFLADERPDKRARKIDELLGQPAARRRVGDSVQRDDGQRRRRRSKVPTN